MGLQEILNEIHQESDAENNDIIAQAKLQSDKIIVDKVEELNSIYSAKKEFLESELKRLSAKLTAKAELDAIRERQKVEVELIEGVMNDAYSELANGMRKDEKQYLAFLIRMAKGAIKLVDPKTAGLSFSKEDEKYFDAIKKELKMEVKLLPASKITGGLVCISGDTYVDNSLETLYNRMRPAFVKMVADILS